MKQFVLLLLWAALASGADLLRYEASLDAMGGNYSVVVYGLDRYKLEAAVTSAFDEIRRIDALISNYKPSSEWSEINRRAGEQPVVVSSESARLIAQCLEYSRRSEGAFDITVGPLMKLWGFFKKEGRIPHRSELRDAMSNIGWQNVQVNLDRRSVRFLRPRMEIDPGGIGKGYAVDQAAEILREAGIQSGFISAATSTLYAIGAPPSEPKGWKVQIHHPQDRRKSVAEVFLRDQSLSTSGNYEKFFEAGGKRYSHIMDPRTGYPAEGIIQASVIAPRAIDSEAWTKPVYINGRAWMKKAQAQHSDLKSFRVHTCEDGWEPKCAWLQ